MKAPSALSSTSLGHVLNATSSTTPTPGQYDSPSPTSVLDTKSPLQQPSSTTSFSHSQIGPSANATVPIVLGSFTRPRGNLPMIESHLSRPAANGLATPPAIVTTTSTITVEPSRPTNPPPPPADSPKLPDTPVLNHLIPFISSLAGARQSTAPPVLASPIGVVQGLQHAPATTLAPDVELAVPSAAGNIESADTPFPSGDHGDSDPKAGQNGAGGSTSGGNVHNNPDGETGSYRGQQGVLRSPILPGITTAAILIGGQTLQPGAPPITRQGIPISRPTTADAIVIGGTTVPFSEASSILNGIASASLSIANEVVIAGQTLVAGAPAITITDASITQAVSLTPASQSGDGTGSVVVISDSRGSAGSPTGLLDPASFIMSALAGPGRTAPAQTAGSASSTAGNGTTGQGVTPFTGGASRSRSGLGMIIVMLSWLCLGS